MFKPLVKSLQYYKWQESVFAICTLYHFSQFVAFVKKGALKRSLLMNRLHFRSIEQMGTKTG